MCNMVGWKLLWLVAFGGSVTPSKEQLYQRARQLASKKQHRQALGVLQQLSSRFAQEAKKHPAGSRARAQLSFGRYGVQLEMASLRWKLGERRQTCKGLPQRGPTTTRWHRLLQSSAFGKQLERTRLQLRKSCARVPSQLFFDVSPKHAKIFVLVKPEAGKAERWRLLSSRQWNTTESRLTLRFVASGHKTLMRRGLHLPRWSKRTLKIKLKPAPPLARKQRLPPRQVSRRPQGPAHSRGASPGKRRKAPKQALLRPRPLAPIAPTKPGTPFYKTWWFWTLTGTLVVGGTTAAILAATLSPKVGFSASKPYAMW